LRDLKIKKALRGLPILSLVLWILYMIGKFQRCSRL
jgi:hypothetical protein